MPGSPLICVVDDDIEVRESIDSFFRSAGIAVAQFERGEDLLGAARLAAMTCLITDLHMPGMSGLDLIDELKRRGMRVPVILMTAYPTAQAQEQAEARGIESFVAKPTDPECLLSRVQALIDSRA